MRRLDMVYNVVGEKSVGGLSNGQTFYKKSGVTERRAVVSVPC